jgi:hypothetical protein
MFPAPPIPAFPDDQAATLEGHLRYEDVTQDGRLIPIAVPPALAGLWREVLVRHPGARAAATDGVIPILTRLTIETLDQPIRVDRPIATHCGFELARDDGPGDPERLYMNIWCELRGIAGRIVPHEPAGPLSLAGRLFAEHTFTRPFGPPDQRRVTRLPSGYPEIPQARYAAPPAASAGEAPAGASWLGELVEDAADVVLGLDQTDSNQHVNSLVYIRIFLDAAARRLAAIGLPLAVRSRAVDIAYRKPCFAGDRVRAHVRLFEDASGIGAAGVIAPAGQADRPRCYVRVWLGP